MDPTLGLLLALPAPRTLVFIITDGLGRVVVTDTLVPAVKQLVIRHVVLRNVLLNLLERPVGKGVNFNQTRLVDLNHVEITALATLAATTTREDSMHVKLAVSTLSRLDLGHPVVELVVGLPQLGAVLLGKVGFRVHAVGLVDVDVVVGVPLADAVDESKGLLEVVQGVEEDQVDDLWARHIQLGEHVESDQAG